MNWRDYIKHKPQKYSDLEKFKKSKSSMLLKELEEFFNKIMKEENIKFPSLVHLSKEQYSKVYSKEVVEKILEYPKHNNI